MPRIGFGAGRLDEIRLRTEAVFCLKRYFRAYAVPAAIVRIAARTVVTSGVSHRDRVRTH
jgi:hypothetical protein